VCARVARVPEKEKVGGERDGEEVRGGSKSAQRDSGATNLATWVIKLQSKTIARNTS